MATAKKTLVLRVRVGEPSDLRPTRELTLRVRFARALHELQKAGSHGCSSDHPASTRDPVVTIARYAKVPCDHPYEPTMSLPKGVPGWAVEVLHHPAGGIGVAGFYRDEAVAWQQASRLAIQNGWRAERNRRVALQAARSAVMDALP